MNAHWPVWGLLSLPIYSPKSSRIVLIFCSAIILSGNMNSWLWRLYFHFLESFGISKFMYTHRLMFKSGFVTALQLTIFVIKALHKQFEHFWWQHLSFRNVNVTWAVFVAAIIGNDWQLSWILIRLLRNNICKNELIKVSYPQQHIHVLIGKYHKKMTIKIRDMEIPILVLSLFCGPIISLSWIVLY